MNLSCFGSKTEPYFSKLRPVPGVNLDAFGFFAAARGAGLVGWEDDLNVSISEALSKLLY